MRNRPVLAVIAVSALALSGLGVSTASAEDPDDRIGVSGTALGANEVGRSANIKRLANVAPSGALAGSIGTDIAFQDDKAFVGNYAGFSIIDVQDPNSPKTLAQVSCPGGQNDITVSGDLLYLSTDEGRNNDSCTSQPLSETRKESWEGIKIFDISDLSNPKYVQSVETKCGSHTNTLVPGKGATAGNDYIYVSSFFPSSSFPDCTPPHDVVSIVKVPKSSPTSAKVIAAPNLFPSGTGRSATSGCHDITALPHKDLAAGACMGDGIIMDIADPEKPRVIERVQDTANFAFWHSATFNKDATKVVFTDELGGGASATCNASTGPKRGANAIYDLAADGQLSFKSYYKIPRHQGSSENCVAHNGSIIPAAGRDIMVQSWYQGGVSVWDFTDSTKPKELGYFERGPLSPRGLGGSWSAYYYNGHIFSSDLAKGFDIAKFEDPATALVDEVVMDEFNAQTQPNYTVR